MKKTLLAIAAVVGVALVGLAWTGTAVARPDECPPGVEKPSPGDKLVKVKRTIATELCVAMARSGAYTDLDDNAFSDFCIKVASHLGDSAYDHTD